MLNAADLVYERRLIQTDETIAYPNANELLTYWNEKRGARAFPAWRDIDLMDLWRIAPSLIVKDVIDGGADFFNRFWGTRLVERAGFDATGKRHLDIYSNHPLGPQMESYLEVIAYKRGNIVHRNSSFISGKDYIRYISLNLPLGKTDDQVDHIISVIDYEDEKPDE